MSDSTTIKDEPRLVLEMTRRFQAPREKVFDAWSSVDAMTGWFGPAECAVLGGEIDFREGGRYRLRLKTESFGEIAIGGIYREVSRPGRLVFSWKWEGHEELCPVEMEVAVDFREAGEGVTELRLVQTGFPEREVAEHHSQGWSGTFDKLGPWLASG